MTHEPIGEILPELVLLRHALHRGPELAHHEERTAATIAHNTVVIDRASQDGSGSDGDLLAYFPDTDGVSVVEADGKLAGLRQAEPTSEELELAVDRREVDEPW